MSFSSDVKGELSRQLSGARHCQIAEIAGIVAFEGKIEQKSNGAYGLSIMTENVAIARKYFTLIKKTFNINTEISVRQNSHLKKNKTYNLRINEPEMVAKVLRTIKYIDEDGMLDTNVDLVNGMVIQRSCCKRAFLRGAFMAAGSISDPEKSYHFEIVCDRESHALRLQEIIASFGIEAKIIARKKYFVLYIKEASLIVDMLNIVEAHVALMTLENIRILKDVRNSVNRGVNCDTANINKIVSAASNQLEDINFIKDNYGLDVLPENLREMAQVRLDNPETSLKELGEMLSKPVGKSGVNHRLRKISSIAEELRNQGGFL